MNGRDEQLDSVSIVELLRQVPDPRVERSRLHSSTDIILWTLMAMIAGADDWVPVQQCGEMNSRPAAPRPAQGEDEPHRGEVRPEHQPRRLPRRREQRLVDAP